MSERRIEDEGNHESDIEKTRMSQRKQKKIDEKRDIEQNEIRNREVVRKANEGNRELKQYEKMQNGENVEEEDNISDRILELATANRKYVNSSMLHQLEKEFPKDGIDVDWWNRTKNKH